VGAGVAAVALLVASGTIGRIWALIPTTIQSRSWEGVDVSRWSEILWWKVSDLQGIADRWQTTRADLKLVAVDPISMLFGIGLGAF
jgi:hypothetical protein